MPGISRRKNPLVFKAPNDSGAHKALLELAQEALARETYECLRDFLWLINAHFDLVAFVQVCENTLRILNSPGWQSIVGECRLERLPAALSWLVSNHKVIAKRIRKYDPAVATSFDRQPKRLGRTPLYGRGMTRHQLYATVAVRHEDVREQPQYLFLQGCLLFGHARALRPRNTRYTYEAYDGAREWNALPNLMKGPSEAVRALATEQSSMWFDLLRFSGDPVAFTEHLGTEDLQSRLGTLPHRERELQRSLQYFFEKVFLDRPWDEREPWVRGVRAANIWAVGHEVLGNGVYGWTNPIGDPEDGDVDWGAQTIITAHSVTTSEAKELLDADDDPGEDASGTYVVMSEFSGVDASNVAEHLAIAKAQANHIEMANQFLPWTYPCLADDEIGTLLIESSDWLHEKFTSTPSLRFSESETELLETLAFLHTVVWTGSGAQSAITATCAPDEKNAIKLLHETREQECALCFVPSRSKDQLNTWFRRALVPPYAQERAPVAGECEREPYISLPDVVDTWFYLRLMLEAKGGRIENSKAFPLFDATRFERKIKDLKLLLKEHDPTGRITVGKLEMYLFRSLLQFTGGDIATASMITGYPHPLAHARLFYATPPRSALQKTYSDTVKSVADRLRRARSRIRPEDQRQVQLSPPTVHVGSRQNPTRSTVEGALSELKRRVREDPSRILVDRRKYHNRFTVYTTLMSNFVTGIRALNNPVPRLCDINPRTKVMRVLDKGPFKARPGLIAEFLEQQLTFYDAHVDRLCGRISSLRPLLVSENLVGRCFFLDDADRPLPVIPSRLEVEMSDVFPFAANVQRRFLRNVFVAEKWPSEVIDAFLSHWSASGEQWFADYSSFPPREYLRFLKQHLFPLLEKLGFQAVKSALK